MVKKFFGALVVWLYGSHPAGATTAIACPVELGASTQTVDSPIAGWTIGRAPGRHVLNSFMVFSGSPAEKSNEIYDREKIFTEHKIKKFHEFTWDLKQIGDPWIQCGYVATSITLTRELVGYQSCKAVFIEDVGGDLRIESAECR